MNVQVNRNSFGALALIAAGVLLFAFQALNIDLGDILGQFWTLLVMAPGIVFLLIAWSGDRSTSGFAFPGMIIFGTGAILTYQNLTDHWESWAYIWTLYPGLVGMAMIFNGSRQNAPNEVKTGRQMLQWSLVAFVIGLVFFEYFIFGGNTALVRYLLPAALLTVGAWLLLARRNETGEKPKRTFVGGGDTPGLKASDADITPELRRKIDEALREGDPV
ncbi:MAG: hypothetical protein L6Q98_05335 [Anaerolineae bacterium]|nr:hypothetical protein [Anaerolineae bacterium]NUQ03641.1 hypothetical protein [Anaerolineae bacterium]